MPVPVSTPIGHEGQLGRRWSGNGLDDSSWAPILEISERVVPQVLSVLAAAGPSLVREAAGRRDRAWR